MAQRRMFSQRITNSGRFLQMSQSAQALYFHLGMRADDDGVVEAYSVMKITNSADDDFKILVAKGFIKALNNDFVSYILDWNEHNLIRADRKIDSIYKDLLMQIVPEADIVTPRPRADTGVLPRGKVTGRPVDNQRTAQYRLGEVRIGKDSTEREPSPGEIAKKFFDGDKELVGSIGKQLEDAGINSEIVLRELLKFKNYWTEPTKSGKKQRWELQPTFDVKRRLGTWFRNIAERSGSNKRAGGGVTV